MFVYSSVILFSDIVIVNDQIKALIHRIYIYTSKSLSNLTQFATLIRRSYSRRKAPINRRVIYTIEVTHDKLSNINASEDNVESPSTYGNEAYKEHRKEEKKKKQQQNEDNLKPNDTK